MRRWERLTAAMIRQATTDTGNPEAGTPDPEAFAQVVALLDDARAALATACEQLRTEGGYSWAEVGAALGVSRSAAQQRFGRRA